MLLQGQTDTLFDLGDVIANYRMWKAKGQPVKMVFKLGGHSGGAAVGEYNNTDPSKGYLTAMTLRWFQRWLKKDTSVNSGSEVEYYKDWVTYPQDGSVSAQSAYGSAPGYPFGNVLTLYMSGGNTAAETGEHLVHQRRPRDQLFRHT